MTVQVKKKYTVEEQAMGIENVRTGLKRDLEESDDEEDEEDEEEDEDEDEDEEESAAAQGGAGGQAVGSGAPAAATGKTMLKPEHLFWLGVQGDIDIPPNVEFESQRKETRPTRRPAPPR